MTTIQMIDALPSPGADDTTFVAPFLRRFTGCEADLSPLIEAGEQRLADTRDNQLAMVIHYMVANALADGLQHSRSDTAAVRRAISHYRQALALESTPPSPHSRRARWILWRLQAGLLSGIQTYNLECGDD
jgi:hypothetical protein